MKMINSKFKIVVNSEKDFKWVREEWTWGSANSVINSTLALNEKLM